MGRLIDRERRARAKQAKRVRKDAIRKEGRRSFMKMPYVEITLDSIGRRAGVKNGIASMYFGSKEELFLELLLGELEEWYGALEDRLSSHQARVPDAALIRLLARSLSERPTLTRFLALAPLALEQNMEIMAAHRFHRWQLERMEQVGRELERRSKLMGRGDGLRLLHRIQLIAAAIQPFADPRGSLAVNLVDPDFADLRVDMETEIANEVARFLAARAG